jgi:hypothetical protein
MVVNAAFFEGLDGHADGALQGAQGFAPSGREPGTNAGGRGETDAERAERVRRLAQLVKGGGYDVQAHRLAAALLDWDPRRSTPRGSAETADRRRAYMRDYMRRRRAASTATESGRQEFEELAAPPAAGAAWPALALPAA